MSQRPERSPDFVKPVLDFTNDPGRTKQSMRDECNVNLIVAKFQKTGVLSYMTNKEAVYMDVDPLDYQDALNTLRETQNMFDELPSKIRKRFENNPQKFLEFCQDPKNQEEIYDLGLADRPPPPPDPTPPATV